LKTWMKKALYFASAIILTASLSIAFTVRHMNASRSNEVLLTTDEYRELSDFVVLNEIIEKVHDLALEEESPEREEMVDEAAKGMVEALEDSYAAYYSAEEYELYLSNINGAYNGIGMLIGQPDENGAKVLDVYEDYAADKAGVKVGDILIDVDGNAVAGMLLEDVSALINAEVGADVSLTFLRNGESYSVDLSSSLVNIPRVEYALFNERTGYIRIDMFTGNCASEFDEAIKDLTERGMRSLVIDLRNNPGGALDSVVSIADTLLDKGTIVSVQGRNDEEAEVYSARGSGVSVPLAIIVNENSASASEILAAAVQENEAGIVVGMRTYGKGIVQTTIRLSSNNGWLKLTTDAYYTPKGNSIHGLGVTPDIEVDLPRELKGLPIDQVDQDDDAQLWAALDYVRELAK